MTPIISTMKVQPTSVQSYQQNIKQDKTQQTFTAAQTNTPAGIQADKIVPGNPLVSAATSTPENPVSFVGQAAAALAVLFGANYVLNEPLLQKNFDETFYNKIVKWGDKIGEKSIVKTAGGYLSALKSKASAVVDKSEILKTLFRKESLGGSMVMSQAAGTKNHLAGRALEAMKAYAKNTGYTGFDALIQKAEKDSYLYYDEIINAIKTSGADLTKVISKRPWWGLGLIKNKKSLQEILNKDILVQNYKGVGKTFGQRLSGYFMRATDCVTNGVFGGKGQVLLQALFVAQSLNEGSKAEKGEKFSTFMASFMELMAFMATMSIQQRVVNHLAGLKYIGMSPANVAKYKEAIKLANEAAKAKDFAAHALHSGAAKQLMAESKTGLSFFQKSVKWLGNLTSFGRIRETIKPLKSNMASNIFSKIGYGLKVGTGYIGRVALIAAVIIPIFSGIAKKVSYGIFGKPVKTLEREKQKELVEVNLMKEEAQAAQQETPASQSTVTPPQNVAPQAAVTAQAGNLLNRMNGVNQQQVQQPIGAQPMTQQPIASAPISQSPDAGIKRTYIPNPILGVENTPQRSETHTAEIDKVLRQADLAEQQASKYM